MTKYLVYSICFMLLSGCAAKQVPTVIARPAETVITQEPVYDPESGEELWKMKFHGALTPEITPGSQSEIPRDFFGIHLFRHAEKLSGPKDPDLTDYGKARAEFIADHLGSDPTSIVQVWSSDYARSRETARPLAEKLGVEIRLYDPRDLPALSEKLLEEKSDAVVIGHSNTTPDLAAILCECEIEPMHETDYERGFLAVFGRGVHIVREFDMRKMWTARPQTSAPEPAE